MAQKKLYYSQTYKTSQLTQAETGPVAAAPARPVATRRFARAGMVILVACFLVAMGLVLVVPTLVGGATAPSASRSASPAQPSHVAVYGSAAEAQRAIGVSAPLPQALPEGYSLTGCSVVDSKILELVYSNGREELRFRVAAGSDDLSGTDVSTQPYTITETVDGIVRSYAGLNDLRFSYAVWANGGYSYAVVAEAGTEAQALRVVAESVV